MKLTLNVLESHHRDADRHWPSYIFGGRIRTSTLVLIIAFFLTWWTYNTYRPHPPPPVVPQVVPPGYVPDPNYTWVPRTRVQSPTSGHADHHGPDHDAADHASYDDNAAAADSAACAAAAVRSWYDSYSISRAGARVPGSGACTRAASSCQACRLPAPAR